jgi:microcin C transport system substrate-binding protein
LSTRATLLRLRKMKNYLKIVTVISLLFSSDAFSAHGYSQLGTLKYPADFTHFEYANPNAPIGGKLVLSNTGASSSFDKFNPFSVRGRPAPGLMELVFETLAVYSLDESNTQYGLLAETIEVAEDFTSVRFKLRNEARFSNGKQVTAEDVVFSFATVTGSESSPGFVAYFSEIQQVTVISADVVEFQFTRAGRDLPFVAGSLPVFSRDWGLNADGSRTPFKDLTFEPPIASGPYTIAQAEAGRTISYQRVAQYWGDQVPTRKGSFNFGTVSYKLYSDVDTQVAGIRSGDYDFYHEIKMRYWCCQYIGKRFERGEIVKEILPHNNPAPMQGYILNTRRAPFDDPRVRLALLYALDFEWINEKVFDNFFGRVYSFFSRTPLAASGLPSADELALLEPWRDQLDEVVFGPAFELPSTGKGQTVRDNLARALELLAEAGWHFKDGALRNEAGEPLILRVSGSRGVATTINGYYHNLKRIGVIVEEHLSDPAANLSRMRNFDFDFTRYDMRYSRQPGAELWRAFNSADADVPGSDNLIGVKSPVIDDLLLKLLNADNERDYIAAGRALDRVLMHGHYVQPWRYLDSHHIIYNSRLAYPKVLPLYYGATDWALAYWWDKQAVDAQN